MLDFTGINWLAVLVAGIVSMAIGFVFASFSGPRLAVWALYTGYVAISMAVMGLILGWWR